MYPLNKKKSKKKINKSAVSKKHQAFYQQLLKFFFKKNLEFVWDKTLPFLKSKFAVIYHLQDLRNDFDFNHINYFKVFLIVAWFLLRLYFKKCDYFSNTLNLFQLFIKNFTFFLAPPLFLTYFCQKITNFILTPL